MGGQLLMENVKIKFKVKFTKIETKRKVVFKLFSFIIKKKKMLKITRDCLKMSFEFNY